MYEPEMTCFRCKGMFRDGCMRSHKDFMSFGPVCPDCFAGFDEIAKTTDEKIRKIYRESDSLGPMGKIAEGFWLGWSK